jgi:transcriptional regulator with XRE-family HTH domain
MQRFDGKKLATIRKRSRLRVEHVAVAIDRSVASVHFYESGRIDPPASIVAMLADVLGIAAGELFTVHGDEDVDVA